MSWRKGYKSEYIAKKELIAEYGASNVVKMAISQQGADFLVLKEGKLILIVEVKQTQNEIYYPSSRERAQFERIKAFAQIHKAQAELWIYANNIKSIQILY